MRAAVSAALASGFASNAIAERYANCGTNAWVLRSDHDPPRYRVAAAACHSRFCPVCARLRARRIASNLRSALPPGDYRFLTLTLRSSPDPLRVSIRRLYAAFARLRRTRAWAAHVAGGVAFLELTRNSATQLWHPHLHVVLAGSYWPVRDISALWLRTAGDSPIVDIRRVRNLDDLAHYVVKYASKGFAPNIWRDREILLEAMSALKHAKLCLPFGSLRSVRLTARPQQDALWFPVCSADTLIARALSGDPEAERIALRLWGRAWVLFSGGIPP